MAGGAGDGNRHVIDGRVRCPEGFDARVEARGAGEEDVEEVWSLLLGSKGKGLLAYLGVDPVALGKLEEEDGEVVWKRGGGREGGKEGGRGRGFRVVIEAYSKPSFGTTDLSLPPSFPPSLPSHLPALKLRSSPKRFVRESDQEEEIKGYSTSRTNHPKSGIFFKPSLTIILTFPCRPRKRATMSMNHQSPSYWWLATTIPAVMPSGMSREGGREGG